MGRRSLVQFGLITLAMLALATPARAGGWALVTLDQLPVEPRAGQTLRLGFMVRQHGVTPIDGAFGTEPMTPRLSASNVDTGESIRADARKGGPVGYFVVDVTFPSAGVWEWQITPEPFQATRLGQLTVLAAAASPAEPAAPTGTVLDPAISRAPLRWIGAFMVLAAASLALAGRRGTPARARTLRPH